MKTILQSQIDSLEMLEWLEQNEPSEENAEFANTIVQHIKAAAIECGMASVINDCYAVTRPSHGTYPMNTWVSDLRKLIERSFAAIVASEPDPEWMTVPEFAKFVRLGEDKIRQWCKQGRFQDGDSKYVEGRQYRLHRDALQRLKLGRD
jgi:hypothetical protein